MDPKAEAAQPAPAAENKTDDVKPAAEPAPVPATTPAVTAEATETKPEAPAPAGKQ
jgi:hypothetical protein